MTAVVYRAYDKALTLIYVGSTVDFPARVAEHFRSSRWTGVNLYWLTTEYETLAEARDAEKVAIRTENPLENKVGRVRGWADPASLTEVPHDAALVTTRADARDMRRRKSFADRSRVITHRSAARIASRVYPNPVLDVHRRSAARRSRAS